MSDTLRTDRPAGNRFLIVLVLLAAIPLSALLAHLVASQWFEDRLSSISEVQRANADWALSHAIEDLRFTLRNEIGFASDFATSPDVAGALMGGKSSPEASAASAYLERRTHDLGIDLAWVIGLDGICIASSNSGTANSLVGENFADRPYFISAMQGQVGRHFAVGRRTNIPGLFFSVPVKRQGKVAGVLVVKANLDNLAVQVLRRQAVVGDNNGVIILSNDPEDLFRTLPGAKVYDLDAEKRLQIYKRADFFPRKIEPAQVPNHPEVIKLGEEGRYAVLSYASYPDEGLQLMASGDMGPVQVLEEDRGKLQVGLILGGVLVSWTLIASLVWRTSSYRRLQSLRQAEAHFRAAFQHAAIGVALVSPDGRWLQVNEALCKLLDYPEADLLQCRSQDLSHPEDVKGEMDLMRELLVGQRLSYQFEKRYINRHGDTVRTLLNVSLVRDSEQRPLHFVVQIQDISERHRAEEALRGYVREIQDLYDYAPCGYHSLDADGVIVRINDTELRWLGYNWREVVGRMRFQDLLAPNSLPIFDRSFAAFKAKGQLQDLMLELRRKDGSVMPAMINATAIYDANGGYLMSRSTVYDMTERKRIEDDLAKAKVDAEAANRAKSDFVANMSHEIRTPMNAVLGLAHLLSKSALEADQRDLVDKITLSARSLLGIIDEILDFSKIEADRLQLESIDFTLDSVLDSLSTVMSVNAAHKDLELNIQVDPDVPRQLCGDPSRLQQILINLTGNAVKFTEKGEVGVTIRRLPTTGGGVRLAFAVRDSGIGISAEQMARLFTPFTQADSTTTRRFGGTGLGLVICRRLAMMMGGGISVSSQLGEGSEFLLELPFMTSELAEEPAPVTALTVLLADDHPTARSALAAAAETLGWTADLVSSGDEVRERLRAAREAEHGYDLLVMDLRLDGEDDPEAGRRLRAQDGLAELPLVFLVNGRDRDLANQPETRDYADAVLVKPVTRKSLEEAARLARSRRLGDGGSALPRLEPTPEAKILSGLRLLLVEDNAINQEVAQFILEERGAQVEIVGDGRQAVELLRLDGQAFDLVLMDVQMPEMDGFEATQLIRRELGLGLPVLALTAGVRDSDRARCLECGMNDFIAKPFDLEQMMRVILAHAPKADAPKADVPGPDVPGPEPLSAAVVAPEPEPESVKKLAAFDKRQGLIRLGDEAVLMEMLKKLVDSNTDLIERLQALLADGKVEEAGRALHSLRGASANVAAIRLATLASKTEAAVLDERDDLPAHLAELAEAYDELKAVVETL